MNKVWVELPEGLLSSPLKGREKLHLRYSWFTAVLRVYHRDEQVAEVIASSEGLPRNWAHELKKAGLVKDDVVEGTVRFNIAKRGVEIDSRLVKAGGIPWYIYMQCEIVVRVDRTQIFERRFGRLIDLLWLLVGK